MLQSVVWKMDLLELHAKLWVFNHLTYCLASVLFLIRHRKNTRCFDIISNDVKIEHFYASC